MKGKIIFIVILVHLIPSCNLVQTEEIENLNIDSFVVMSEIFNSDKKLKLTIIDSANYYNNVTTSQKIELSLQDQLSKISNYDSIEIFLNMPNRDEQIIGYKLHGQEFIQNLPKKYENVAYKTFVQSLIRRLNEKNNIKELDAMNTSFQIARNGDNTGEDWYGVNSLDVLYNYFNGTSNEFVELLDSVKIISESAFPEYKELYNEMYKFLLSQKIMSNN